jgi:hypothetical protein
MFGVIIGLMFPIGVVGSIRPPIPPRVVQLVAAHASAMKLEGAQLEING